MPPIWNLIDESDPSPLTAELLAWLAPIPSGLED
jgi:hypothetical protein